MKTGTKLCCFVALVTLLAGCRQKQDVAANITLSSAAQQLVQSGISAPATGVQDIGFAFQSAIRWTMSAADGASKAHADWIVLNPPAGGSGDATVAIYINENPELTPRSGVITLSSGEIVKTIQVSQAGREPIGITAMVLSEQDVTLFPGEELQLTATIIPSNTDVVAMIEWTSSNPAVATVESGLIEAVAKGTATITAKAGGMSTSCTVTVLDEPVPEPVPVSGISLSQTALDLQVGEEATLVATVKPANADDPTVTWTSSNPAVATVSAGVVKAIAEGEAVITAKAGDKSATCKVTVSKPGTAVTSVELNQTSAELKPGETLQLTAAVLPADATATVSWTSSAPDVATVSASGLVVALKEGSATITAAAGGKSATCAITVLKGSSSGSGAGGEDLEDPVDIDPWS